MRNNGLHTAYCMVSCAGLYADVTSVINIVEADDTLRQQIKLLAKGERILIQFSKKLII